MKPRSELGPPRYTRSGRGVVDKCGSEAAVFDVDDGGDDDEEKRGSREEVNDESEKRWELVGTK